jgi:hypothetical protein
LKRPLQMMDMRKMFEENTYEELFKKYQTNYKDKHVFNQRYLCETKTDKFLDIPCLFEFFSYNFRIPLIQMAYSAVIFHVNFPYPDKIKEYVTDMYLIYEEFTLISNETRKKLAMSASNYLTLSQINKYFHEYTSSNISCETQRNLKFIYIIMRSDNNDVTNNDFPSIESLQINDNDRGLIMYDKCNFYVKDFEKFRIYGISADDSCDMNDWTSFINETVCEFEMDRKLDIKGCDHTNLNDAFYSKFKCLQNPKNIDITLSPYNFPVNIEILFLNQNIMKIEHGMAGNMLAL